MGWRMRRSTLTVIVLCIRSLTTSPRRIFRRFSAMSKFLSHLMRAPLLLLLALDRFHAGNIPPDGRNASHVFNLFCRQLEPQVEEFLHQLLAFFLQLVAAEFSQLARFHTACPQSSIRVVKNRVAIGSFWDARCMASRATS